MANQTRIISIEGNIGTGKSTFIKNLQERMKNNKDVIFLQEPVSIWNTIKDENNKTILERYYADQEQFAFPFQMMAYISRLALLRNALRENPKVIITERSLMTDKMVFASMLKDDNKISKIGYTIYNKWFNEFLTDMPTISYVYLRCDPSVSSERVIKRNRKGETIPLEYLERCHMYHDKWLLTKPPNENKTALCLAADADFNKDPNAMECCIKATIELIENNPKEYLPNYNHSSCSYKLMFDGASRGNPGPASLGYVIYKDNQRQSCACGKEFLQNGPHTNNYAEYMALIKGLEAVININPKPTKLHIEGDSMLVIKQVTDKYKVNSESLKPLYKKVKDLLKKLPIEITFKHIKRNKNKVADNLANDALDYEIINCN